MTAVRNFFKWVYNWITVIAGVVTGALAFVVPFMGDALRVFDIFVGVNLAPFGISAETAAAITSTVALLKGLHAWYLSRAAASTDPDYSAGR